uniref:Inosine/uridine-preferring nucleoside hydrolase domain-containing protein n=1 Tax=Leersia perrieri TaxID=77586 RepID=A0A0D9WGD5_9ORYZ
MTPPWRTATAVVLLVVTAMATVAATATAAPRRILVDTDMDTDDLLALLYLLKLNRSEFDLQAVTIDVNAWSDAGHAVNHLYDMLYMMGRDDIPVGVGGDGGISGHGTIHPNVGGYLPLIDQGMTTFGPCRYRQAIPLEGGGRLDVDTNFGIRRGFLPQKRGAHIHYGWWSEIKEPYRLLSKKFYHALLAATITNPNAEFNMFADPFAAYQVFHSGIPITLIPLDATNTIPINEEFFDAFQKHHSTYEAQYCFESLKMARDTWFNDEFYTSYFMWDSFTSGVAISSMRNDYNCQSGNDFAELKYMNITVITSNKPYGIHDGSNPFFNNHATPKFGLQKGGVHSGHVQTGITDSFCLPKGSKKGLCEDGYTKEVSGPEAVQVCVATMAKPNMDKSSPLNREFFKSFLETLNLPENTGRFNITTQFPFYREVLNRPDFTNKSRGKPVIFDMDMSPGDFISLIYLLKAPTELIDLKGILVGGNGWANIASIDIVYDILRMMGRDDIPVGRGNTSALGTQNLGCMYVSAIPQGSGGLLDSDTLYGLARSLPRSPRRYTAENSVKYGAPRDTDHPELRQPLAFEVWQFVKEQLHPNEKITILTSGPLTNLANIVLSDRNANSVIKSVYVVGGHIRDEKNTKGNVFTVPSNTYAEFNMFLDPLAAKTVLDSTLDITLIPLIAQRKASSFHALLKALKHAETPESGFVRHLLSVLHNLQQKHQLYHHMDIFLGELLGAVYLVEGSNVKQSLQLKPVSIVANSTESTDGQTVLDNQSAKLVKVLLDFNTEEYYNRVANSLGDKERSAVISGFAEQRAVWSSPPEYVGRGQPPIDRDKRRTNHSCTDHLLDPSSSCYLSVSAAVYMSPEEKAKRRRRAKMWRTAAVAAAVLLLVAFGAAPTASGGAAGATATRPRRILVDTDMDTDDLFALLYLLKQNRSEFDVKAITINANEWSDAGHAVNHLYDLLHMMGRDDIPVGVGGDGSVSHSGAVLLDGTSTAGGCRYRQAIPARSRLDVDTNFGVRRGFLPQGRRRYRPLRQPTAQRVMADTVSEGPTTVFLFGAHTNLALLLMAHPGLRRNIDRVYVSGGAVRTADPAGNLYTAFDTNPFAEFNIFGDPFAAYQVIHSGIPITMIPLDATNTIPVTEEFVSEFRQHQRTYEAQYSLQSLDQSYYMWDSFAAGVALSSMRNGEFDGGNEFAELEYMNITVITSNKPYGKRDGSNPFFDGRATPKFGLKDGGIHSGHVQTGIRDTFCLIPGSSRGRCQDGYTREVSGPEGVRVRVATRAKPNKDKNSILENEFCDSFLEVLNRPEQTGLFNINTQFPYYRKVLHKPVFRNVSRGKPVIFDMDMSPGDFVSLIYLLKTPKEVIDLKGVLVNGNGWANIASIDIVYDVLHMMGRDDIPVGLGNTTALGIPILGCNNSYAIPHGSGGFIDSDTLYGLARSLPRSPRRYAPGSLDNPERRQPLALEVWQSVRKQLDAGEKITVLTNGPLTNMANISLSDRDASSVIERVYVVGGLIKDGGDENGNVFTVPSNKHAEFNIFLDPLAAKTVLESDMKITLIPLTVQRKAASFKAVLEALEDIQHTHESKFVHELLSLLQELQMKQKLYRHLDIFLGEILGAVYMVEGSGLKPSVQLKPVSVVANTNKSTDGQIVVSKSSPKLIRVLSDFNGEIFSKQLANSLANKTQSAVIGSFEEQKAIWSRPPENSSHGKNKGNLL